MEELESITDITSGALTGEETLAKEQAQNRADRIWKELKTTLFWRSELDNSIFAGPGHAELTSSLGNFRLFRTISQSSPVFSTLFKLNLMFCAMVVFFFTYQMWSGKQIGSPILDMAAIGEYLPIVILATIALAFLAGLLWLAQRPKRLKVLPNMIVLRTDLNDTFFSELCIPWQTVEKIELTRKKLVGVSELETRVEILTALGVKHFVPIDDLLVDNSEASFINAVRTWAPWAARQLTFKRTEDHQVANKGARLTELWLHQFSTTQSRKESGLLPAGTVLVSESAADETNTAERIGKTYTVLGVLGGGGQGNTYLASSSASAEVPEKGEQEENKEVVLKEYILPIYRGSAVLAKLSEKLADEASLLARLDHPLIVKVSDHFVSDFRGYLVLEYVEGRSLKELVGAEGPQPESFVVDVGIKLLQVLRYMHGFDPPIVHRDLSPDNVMVSVGGEIKVVDFNVARQLEGSAGNTVVGKHAYIPPEQFRGRPAPASDIYALGGTLYFLITGQDPEPLSVSRPKKLNDKISKGLDMVVARATQLDLADRYTSAADMLADMSRVLG